MNAAWTSNDLWRILNKGAGVCSFRSRSNRVRSRKHQLLKVTIALLRDPSLTKYNNVFLQRD